MKDYLVEDIFTPSSPARVNFVEREDINRRIVRALKTKGKQVVVYGHSGSGKTTLLENKLRQVYENHIKTNCMRGMTYESVLLDAFDQLEKFYVDEKVVSGKVSVDAGVKANFQLISTHLSTIKVNSEQSKSKRILPPQLTGPNLAKMIGEARYCWVLEDFHKIEGNEKRKLSQLMKVFVDLSDTYPHLKIVAVGAVNTARQVVQFDSEMRRRIAEINVPLMLDNEIGQIVINGCDYLNVNIETSLVDDICHHSNGVASICHQLCELMCEELDIFESLTEWDDVSFDYSNVTYALSEYLELESDTIKRAFDNALKLKDSDDIIYALSELGQSGAKVEEIHSVLHSKEIRYNEKQITAIFKNLLSERYGELIKYDLDSHKYSFSDPFYRTFSLAFFKERVNEYSKKKLSAKEQHEILNSAFRNMREDYSVSQSQSISKSPVFKNEEEAGAKSSAFKSEEEAGAKSSAFKSEEETGAKKINKK